jgi:hypothetical protein
MYQGRMQEWVNAENRRFEFEKRCQLFLSTHNETLPRHREILASL